MTSQMRPYAITMWDFSWLERRWPGAGYEDWDRALGDLAERGYDAVRIDAYPHLLSRDPDRTWSLVPLWTQMAWGAQSPIDVRVGPELIGFIEAAKRVGIKVALSTWYRRDTTNEYLHVRNAEDQARIWIDTIAYIEAAGLLDQILYVDFCNEFPLRVWSGYLYGRDSVTEVSRTSPFIVDWMKRSIAIAKQRFPQLAYTYSFSSEFHNWQEQDVSMLDFMENHVWMVNHCEFNAVVGYKHDKMLPDSFDNLARYGKKQYLDRKEYYDGKLIAHIDDQAAWSRHAGKALVTTECWSIIDYKDWPGLEWAWINDMNARAVEYAASTGRWIGMATSNFCGPQFVGAWQDIAWHRRLTGIIKAAPIDEGLSSHFV